MIIIAEEDDIILGRVPYTAKLNWPCYPSNSNDSARSNHL
uniref:Uncharacterized protein n=1 Tax=Arundo donax TaxID=35708 RepID=A0A0A8ZJB5_ARUDO